MRKLIAALCALLIGSPALAGAPPIPPSAPLTAANMSPQCVFNWTPSSTLRLRTVLAKVRAGTRQTGAFVGDSTTAGYYGGPGAVSILADSYPSQVTSILSSQLPAQNDATWGTANMFAFGGQAAFLTYDPRWTMTSDWGTTVNSVGGPVLSNNTGTGTASFTPVDAWNTAVVYYLQGNGFGTFTIGNGGGTLATVNAGSPTTSAVVAVTVNQTLGTGPVNIARTGTGGEDYIVGIRTYNSAQNPLEVWNMGWGSSTSTNWVPGDGQVWDPVTVLHQLAPNLMVLNLTINDPLYSTAPATYKSNIQALITAVTSNGGAVVMMTGNPSNPTAIPLAARQQYDAIFKGLALSNNVPVLDSTCRWTSYAASTALYANTLHPNTTGYADLANFVFSVLRPQ
jgi:hypothetical protein